MIFGLDEVYYTNLRIVYTNVIIRPGNGNVRVC